MPCRPSPTTSPFRPFSGPPTTVVHAPPWTRLSVPLRLSFSSVSKAFSPGPLKRPNQEPGEGVIRHIQKLWRHHGLPSIASRPTCSIIAFASLPISSLRSWRWKLSSKLSSRCRKSRFCIRPGVHGPAKMISYIDSIGLEIRENTSIVVPLGGVEEMKLTYRSILWYLIF